MKVVHGWLQCEVVCEVFVEVQGLVCAFHLLLGQMAAPRAKRAKKDTVMANGFETPEGQWFCTLEGKPGGVYFCKQSGKWGQDGCPDCEPSPFRRYTCIPCPSASGTMGRIAHSASCPCPRVRGGTGRDQGRLPDMPVGEEEVAREKRIKVLKSQEANYNKLAAERRAEREHLEDGGEVNTDEPPPDTPMQHILFHQFGKTGGPLGSAYTPELDTEYFIEVVNLLIVRLLMLAKFLGRPSTKTNLFVTSSFIEEKAFALGVRSNMIYQRVGCPFRELCKGTVYIIGRVARLSLADMLYNIIAYRLWFNHPGQWTTFLEKLGVPHLDYRSCPRSWLYNAALGVEEPRVKRFRTGVCSVWAFVVKLRKVVPFVTEFAETWGLLKEATFVSSVACLRAFQLHLGPFVGLQCLLDLSMLRPAFFDANLVAECGPGALSTLTKLYPVLPREDGMSSSRFREVVATPFLHHLHREFGGHKELQEILDEYRFPRLSLANTQYWCCETRQWKSREAGELLDHEPTHEDYDFYAPTLETDPYAMFVK